MWLIVQQSQDLESLCNYTMSCFQAFCIQKWFGRSNATLNLPSYINKTTFIAYSSHQAKTKPMIMRHTQALGSTLQHSSICGATLASVPGLNFHLQFLILNNLQNGKQSKTGWWEDLAIWLVLHCMLSFKADISLCKHWLLLHLAQSINEMLYYLLHVTL